MLSRSPAERQGEDSRAEEKQEKVEVFWLLAQRERVKIRLSGENTGDACVLSLGTADGLTLLRLQRTQD